MNVKLGAYGINLIAANHIIFVDKLWSISQEMQAIKRAHRIGQTELVTIEWLIVENSCEQQIIDYNNNLLLGKNYNQQDELIEEYDEYLNGLDEQKQKQKQKQNKQQQQQQQNQKQQKKQQQNQKQQKKQQQKQQKKQQEEVNNIIDNTFQREEISSGTKANQDLQKYRNLLLNLKILSTNNFPEITELQFYNFMNWLRMKKSKQSK